jgi:hypothetical protein
VPQITNIRIADPKAKGLVGRAANGQYDHAPGHPSQVIAVDVALEPGKRLEQNHFYAIAANGMPATWNMQFDHTQHTSDHHTLYVFYELREETADPQHDG